jgi:hypothetical protein
MVTSGKNFLSFEKSGRRKFLESNRKGRGFGMELRRGDAALGSFGLAKALNPSCLSSDAGRQEGRIR